MVRNESQFWQYLKKNTPINKKIRPLTNEKKRAAKLKKITTRKE